MLTFTADIDASIAWFFATHELTSDMAGRVRWRRTALPASGGVGDQDCRLMAELEFFQTMFNQLLAERRKAKGTPA